MPRKQWVYGLIALGVIGVGLACREARGGMSGAARGVVEHVAEGLWAVVYFVAVAIVKPRWATWRVMLTSLAIVLAIEFSQLIKVPAMETLRGYRAGRFTLGTTFLWGDVLSLIVGTLLAGVVERAARARRGL